MKLESELNHLIPANVEISPNVSKCMDANKNIFNKKSYYCIIHFILPFIIWHVCT